MRKSLCMGLVLCCCKMAVAQDPYPTGTAVPNISSAEYFFDTDPGTGNGTAIAISAARDINNLNRTLVLNGLTPGFHRLYVRTQDVLGRWSLTASIFFDNYQVPAYGVAGAVPAITAMEYFVDTDPGAGNGTPITVTPGQEISAQQVTINLNGLSAAAHRLYIRTRDANGKWSLTNYGVFDNASLMPYPNAPAAPAPLEELEYFVDTDPGFGKGQRVVMPPGVEVSNFQFSIPLTGVSQGLHTVFVRSKSNPYSLTAYTEFLYGTALPVTWLYVKGEAQSQQHIISWATAIEVNASHFTIEHSEDGVHYAAIGTVKAVGESSSTTSYRFVHDKPSTGWHYYRVIETDKNGITSRSKVITLLNSQSLARTIIAPNPFIDRLQVVLGAKESARRIILYSTNGRQVMEQVISDPQQRFIELYTGPLSTGVYFMKVVYTNKEATYRVIRK